jgi:hypothetical protein
MTDVFSELRSRALERSQDQEAAFFMVRGLWKTELLFRPNPNERTFHHTYVLAQTIGQGCCYCPTDVRLDPDLMGKDAREITRARNPLSIAVLDAWFASLPRQPALVHELQGDSVAKTDRRNAIILAEAERLMATIPDQEVCTVNVGAVGDLIGKLRRNHHRVVATDYDETLVGQQLANVTIEHGARTLEFVRRCGLAIITGMTIANGSLEPILEAAREAGTRMLIFAETGANFAAEYCRAFGVDTVVAEPFPFYIFQGTSVIEVYRLNADGGNHR